ncbi:maleylpyruvate isomerase family mycothiol-dependent enzyme [Amycolatopsis sp. cmx-4-68]|uniref:maleylpyruvate isomerase family mycothiol-dependent enzyme n=1 Tax=Amycolatopsis sp. cmx-4-68 TaxID=2790938 RepID=UPI00397A941B
MTASLRDVSGYPAVRHGIRALLRERPGAGDRVVPACPEWTVADLLGHLVGIGERVLERFGGRPPVVGGSSAVPVLLDRWDDVGDQLDPLLADAGGRGGEIMVMDAFTHELDLRAALGAPPPEGHAAWAPSFEVLVRGFSRSIAGRGLPAVRLREPAGRETAGEGPAAGREWTAGEGPAAATVTAPAYDLYRALAGRRSIAQLTALNWTAAPEPWLLAFSWGPFSPPAQPGV